MIVEVRSLGVFGAAADKLTHQFIQDFSIENQQADGTMLTVKK